MAFSGAFAGGGGLVRRREINPRIGKLGPTVRVVNRGGGLKDYDALTQERARQKQQEELRYQQEQDARISANREAQQQAEQQANADYWKRREMQNSERAADREYALAQQQQTDNYNIQQQQQWQSQENGEVNRAATAEKAAREQQLFDMQRDHQMAAKGLIVGDTAGVVDYVNRYGNQNANLENIIKNQDGSLSVIAKGQPMITTDENGNKVATNGQGREIARFANEKQLYTDFFGRMKPNQLGEEKDGQKRITETQIVNGQKQLMESWDGGRTWSPVGEPTPAKDNTKPLNTSVEKRLTSAAGLADQMDRLSGSFVDEYGGSPIGGIFDMENTYRKIVGDDTGQAQWWQDYQTYLNDVRHDKFGSALTATEKGEFLKSAITPKMEPGEIKKNLDRQRELSNIALERIMGGYAVNYDSEAISALTGRTVKGASQGTGGGQEQQLRSPFAPNRGNAVKNMSPGRADSMSDPIEIGEFLENQGWQDGEISSYLRERGY